MSLKQTDSLNKSVWDRYTTGETAINSKQGNQNMFQEVNPTVDQFVDNMLQRLFADIGVFEHAGSRLERIQRQPKETAKPTHVPLAFTPGAVHQHITEQCMQNQGINTEQLCVTDDNVSSLFEMMQSRGFTGTLEEFLQRLKSGEQFNIAVRRNSPEAKQLLAASKPGLHPSIQKAAKEETLMKLVHAQIIPAFTHVLANLQNTHEGVALVREYRRVQARLSKLLSYANRPAQISPGTIHDVYELGIYTHHLATLVVAGTLTEDEGNTQISEVRGYFLEKLYAANDAENAALAKEAEDKLKADIAGTLVFLSDHAKEDNPRVTAMRLRELADIIMSEEPEPLAEPEPVTETAGEARSVPPRSDIAISLDRPQQLVNQLPELVKAGVGSLVTPEQMQQTLELAQLLGLIRDYCATKSS